MTKEKEEAKPAVNGQALFASCAACHGQNGEKAALGKSQIIKGWDKQQVLDALNGYKNGTYGGAMKGVMTGQVATKTDAEIDALATYISNL
ncbi:c-type cytochrome [Arcobacter roscoffensis]|uniref:C-type cytochrome n=2 Tax=Arcobacter roscoffensis TaxID=2961520 RepID=A0ABY5EB29_9BACT|nr:c-type cytochrome [Arcobacter roscoffensis]UTJ07925.1 c-type cytochrome [Arcobacter roscoffensis]